jgi:hypothetical protein
MISSPNRTTQQLRIVVLSYVIRGPLGGRTWSKLHYLMGLSRLGHEVFYVEDSDDYPSCYDPVRDVVGCDATYGLRFAEDNFGRIGMGGRWAYYDAHQTRWLGPCADHILDICASADVVINLCGINPLRPWLLEIPARIYIDQDPAFTQIRHLTSEAAREFARQHTAFFSFGETFGKPQSSIPDDGFPWQPTRQPVLIDAVRFTPGPPNGTLTTVMLWDSYPSREYNGIHYGMKSDSFAPYMDLPTRSDESFELAIGSPTTPRERLRRHGWALRDSREPTRDPRSYQDYISQSKAEFSVAKHGYVISHSGWFSERSLAYLASGRPVLTQETGFSDWLDVDAGVLPFTKPIEVLDQLTRLNARYEVHCRAAREVAASYFNAQEVLSRLLENALSSAPAVLKTSSIPCTT